MKEGEAEAQLYFLLSRTHGDATSQSFRHNLFSSHEPNAGMLYDLAFRHQQDLKWTACIYSIREREEIGTNI